jgi:hypothetical protein
MAIISFLNPATMAQVSTFLFVFGTVFGLMTYSKLLEFDKRVNALISLAIAFFAMVYEPLVVNLTTYMPIAAGIIAVLFFVMLIKKVLGGDKKEGAGKQERDTLPIIVALGIMLILLAVFSDMLIPLLPSGISADSVLWGAGILVVILFFWFIHKTKNES